MKNKKDGRKLFFLKKYSKVIPELKNEEEFEEPTNTTFNLFEVVVIVFISVLFGFVVGCILSYTKNNFIGTEVSSEVNEFVTTYNSILDNYYKDVDEKELMNAAISGMISSLDDPYSSYMDSSTTDTFNQSVDGEYVGLGIKVAYSENMFTVVEFLNGNIVEKEGLKLNDQLIKVNDKDITGKTLDEVSELIKGKVNTTVKLTILRDGKEIEIKSKRKVIELQSVSSANYDGIGYIYIERFASNTAKQFNKALKQLEKEKIGSLIIDVRGNPGGHLNQANRILDNFFDNKTVLYKIESKGIKSNVYSSTKTSRKYPVAILTNSSSASAAEILAASFKDNYKNCKIIGTTTYGKGSVQNAVELSSGSSYKYTTQSWLTPKGDSINEVGVTPDIVIEQGDNYCTSPDVESDLQLQKALETLKNETK